MIRRPNRCGDCQSRTVLRHCASPNCPWVTCGKCAAVTWVIGGKLRFVQGIDRYRVASEPEGQP